MVRTVLVNNVEIIRLKNSTAACADTILHMYTRHHFNIFLAGGRRCPKGSEKRLDCPLPECRRKCRPLQIFDKICEKREVVTDCCFPEGLILNWDETICMKEEHCKVKG